MTDIANIKGLTKTGSKIVCNLLETSRVGYTEPSFHPSLIGCYYQCYNFTTEEVIVIDGNTTITQLAEVISND